MLKIKNTAACFCRIFCVRKGIPWRPLGVRRQRARPPANKANIGPTALAGKASIGPTTHVGAGARTLTTLRVAGAGSQDTPPGTETDESVTWHRPARAGRVRGLTPGARQTPNVPKQVCACDGQPGDILRSSQRSSQSRTPVFGTRRGFSRGVILPASVHKGTGKPWRPLGVRRQRARHRQRARSERPLAGTFPGTGQRL